MSLSPFWSHWAWPAATSGLGIVFAGLVLRQWLVRRRRHQLAWGVGLAMYAVAAGMEAWSEAAGVWSPGVYRLYIVLAASLVGFLGLGTLYLIVHRPLWGHLYLGFNLACLAVFLGGAFAVELDRSLLVPGITVGGRGLGPAGSFPRIMSLAFNIPGTLFLLGGALLSIWRFARKREYSYRVRANILIAVGTLIIAFVGARARMGSTIGLYPAEMVASALLLAGFLEAGTLAKGAEAIRERKGGRSTNREGAS